MSDRRAAIGLFVTVLVAYAWFFNGAGWNQNANFDLTRAIVEHRALHIGPYANTLDIARGADGRIYSNKPPGLSFLTVAPYAIVYAIERMGGVDSADPLVLILNLYLCTLVICGGAGAWLAAALFFYARRIGVAQRSALAIALVIAFGTIVFPYSTVLFMHVPNALLLFLAFTEARRRPLLAGVCGGAAVLCNYLSIPIVAVIALLAGRRGILRFVAGTLPFAIALLSYQALVFGSPFATSVETTSPQFLDQHALFGVMRWPDPAVLWAITFSPYRGLFYLSPVLLMAFVGAAMMIRRRVMRAELAAIGAIVALFLLMNASFNGWHGGSAIGPRYLLPIVPLLAIPMLFAATSLRAVWIALTTFSIATCFLASAVNPLPAEAIADPLGAYLLPIFATGTIPESTPRDYTTLIAPGHVSVNRHTPDQLYPYDRHAPTAPASRHASFNLGECLDEGGPWSVLPIALWMIAASAVLLRRARTDELDVMGS